MTSRLVCGGCGASPPSGEPYPFRCPNADVGDDVDHVLRRELTDVEFPADDGEPNPYVRFRPLLHASHLGLSDDELVRLIRSLDARVRVVDGHGFEITPFFRSAELSAELGFVARGGVWVKDETGNVSGSHKARHLFGVMLYLAVAERLELTHGRPELAVASCGNAALAAATVAAAGGWTLRVFVPVDADPLVLERLEELGAIVETCPRTGAPGDPTYARLLQALDQGALPFTCQGNLNGLAVEGGYTLGWELAASGVALDRVVVQVGGGALASACIAGLDEGGVFPRLDTVQTESAWPLKRAFDAVTDVRYAATHRSEFMRPWETEPRSVAHGILDDETYDWLAVVEAMRGSGGRPVVAGEAKLSRANELAVEATGIPVDPTGSAGLAGLLHLVEDGSVRPDERVAVLFTGVDRAHETRRTRDEELLGARHPVAEGVRAG